MYRGSTIILSAVLCLGSVEAFAAGPKKLEKLGAKEQRMTEHLVDDLPVRVELVQQDEREDGDRTYTLKVTAGQGEALLKVQRRIDSPYSDGHLVAESPRSGALFWREIAGWLRVPVARATKTEPGRNVPIQVLSMGALPSKDGSDWKAMKLFIGEESDPAEIYLNVAIEVDRGEFREKDVDYRQQLVSLLRSALGEVEGLPALQPKPQVKKPAPPPWTKPLPFNVGDSVQYNFGKGVVQSGTVKAVRTMEIDDGKTEAHDEVLLEVVFKSGIKMMFPPETAAKELKKAP